MSNTKSPLKSVTERFGSKKELAARLAGILEPAPGESQDELGTRLAMASNAKLLHLDELAQKVADDVKKRYELLSLNFMPTVLPEFGEPMSSCDPINQALLWLSTGSNNAGESEPYVRRERYALAYFFMAQGGIAWAQNTNWISEVDVCQWSGITCDAKGAVVAITMPNNRVIGQVRRFLDCASMTGPAVCVSISHLIFGSNPTAFAIYDPPRYSGNL